MPCPSGSLRSQTRDASLFILLIGLAFVVPIQAAGLNDTGIASSYSPEIDFVVAEATRLQQHSITNSNKIHYCIRG